MINNNSIVKFLDNNSIKKNIDVTFEDIKDSWIDEKAIVMCAGGEKYLSNAYLNIRYIRDVLHSTMPIQIWYLGEKEKIDSIFSDLADRYSNIEFIDAVAHSKIFPFKTLKGWESKIYAITHSKYSEILYLDSDCFLYYQPELLFENIKEYTEFNAVFSADCDILDSGRAVDSNGIVYKLGTFRHNNWHYHENNKLLEILNIENYDYPELESGFMMINKKRCYKEIFLSLYLNENSDFVYQYLYGDKDTYGLAWAYFKTPFYVIKNTGRSHNCITNFYNDEIIFQHRVINTKFDINIPWNNFPNKLISFQKLDKYKPFFDQLIVLTKNFNNIYSDKFYSIDKFASHYMDAFSIKFIDRNSFIITRADSQSGWGQDLSLRILDKEKNTFQIIHVGPSNHNSIIKHLNT